MHFPVAVNPAFTFSLHRCIKLISILELRKLRSNIMDLFTNVSEQIGDDAKLDALRIDLGDEVVAMLLDRAEETVNGTLADLKHAIAEEDSQRVREVAHSIKGATGSLYSVRLAEMAAIVEKQFEDLSVLTAGISEFEKTAQLTIEWWKSKLKALVSS
jgi:HPt (histidine-containing phosphotransfer) domain-containing protein